MCAQRSHRRKTAKATAPVSIEQLEGVALDRRLAFEQGNLCALLDELDHHFFNQLHNPHVDTQLVAANAAGRPPAEWHATADEIDAGQNTLLTLPYWVCFGLRSRLLRDISTWSKGTGQSARWLKRYRMDLIHLHRHVLVRTALNTGQGKWPPGSPDVFKIISRELRGTRFAGTPHAIKWSFENVQQRLPYDGATGRYYQDKTFYPRLVRGY